MPLFKRSQNLDTTMKIGNQWQNMSNPFVAMENDTQASIMHDVQTPTDLATRPFSFVQRWAYDQGTGTVVDRANVDWHGNYNARICEVYDDFIGNTLNTFQWAVYQTETNVIALSADEAYGTLQIDMALTSAAWVAIGTKSYPAKVTTTPVIWDTMFEVNTTDTQFIEFGIMSAAETEQAFTYINNTAAAHPTWGILCKNASSATTVQTGITMTGSVPWQVRMYYENSASVYFSFYENGVFKGMTQVTAFVPYQEMLRPFMRVGQNGTNRHIYDVDYLHYTSYRSRQNIPMRKDYIA